MSGEIHCFPTNVSLLTNSRSPLHHFLLGHSMPLPISLSCSEAHFKVNPLHNIGRTPAHQILQVWWFCPSLNNYVISPIWTFSDVFYTVYIYIYNHVRVILHVSTCSKLTCLSLSSSKLPKLSTSFRAMIIFPLYYKNVHNGSFYWILNSTSIDNI